MSNPKISVLMPTYNAAEYLADAVESILQQSFIDFEFLVVDDGSTDSTVAILKSYTDERISILKGPGKGLAAALNYGIRRAKGQYIARMDADDIADNSRFEKQVVYLDNNPDIGACGTLFQEFMHGDSIHEHMENVRYADLLSGCYIGHPTAMFRRKLFIKHNLFYDETLKYSEDYELWGRAIRVARLGNVQENLLRYRRHAESASIVNVQEMTKLDISIKISMIEYLVGSLSAQEKVFLERMLGGTPLESTQAEHLTVNLLENLQRLELCSPMELFGFLQSCYSFNSEFTGRILEPMLAAVPFFVISFNQLTYLQKIVAFFEIYKIKNVHIIDNNSNYPPLLEYLQTVPFTVHHMDKNYGHMVLFEHEQFKDIINNNYFVLTDPDILPVKQCSADFLRVFMELLLRHPCKNKVGFSLKIDDLPRHYELRENVIAWESRFYSNGFSYNGLTVYDAPLDTTFALYRPRTQWRTNDFYAALRVGKPYVARHLTWYKNLRILNEEDLHYKAADTGSSNWNGRLSSSELHRKYNTRAKAIFTRLFEKICTFISMGNVIRLTKTANGQSVHYLFVLKLLEKRTLVGGAGFYLFSIIPIMSKKLNEIEQRQTIIYLFDKLPIISRTKSNIETKYKLFDRFIFYSTSERSKLLSFSVFPLLSKKTRIDFCVHTALYLFDAIPLISKTTVANNVCYKLFDKFVFPVPKRGQAAKR